MATTKVTKEEVKETLTEEELLNAKVKEWKNKYKFIYKLELADEMFIFRTLKRSEYKEIIRETRDNPDDEDVFDREDKLARKVVLYPESEELEYILENCAGIAGFISDYVMQASGFSTERKMTKL